MIVKILLAVSVVLAIAASGVFYLKYRLDNAPDNKNLAAAIDAEIKKYPLQGLVVGIYKDGKSFIKGYGTVSKDSSTVPDGSTVFQLASVSKLFTASLLQILCDEGVLTLDATLGELLGGTYVLSPAAKQVTLRQLATHTSGFPSIPKPLEIAVSKLVKEETLMQNPYSHLGAEYIVDYLKTTEDKHEPGRFEYSNYGMGLLGHVMEFVTKQDLAVLLAEKIFAPLNMTHTAINLTPAMQKNLAQGYTEKNEPTPMWTFSALAGAGALNANAEDMLTFIRTNIEDSHALSAVLKKTHAPQLGGITGIGWMQPAFLDKFFGNKTIIWHNGMVGGYAAYVSVDSQNKTGLVVLSNKALDVTMLGMMLTRQVRTQSWSEE